MLVRVRQNLNIKCESLQMANCPNCRFYPEQGKDKCYFHHFSESKIITIS